MIKIFCDICEKEATDTDFVFEATLMQMKTLATDPLSPTQRPEKRMIQICKGCYGKKIAKLLKDS